jgi:hypothetical protein
VPFAAELVPQGWSVPRSGFELSAGIFTSIPCASAPLTSRKWFPYGIRPRTLRIGEHQAKGYRREDCMDTFRPASRPSRNHTAIGASGAAAASTSFASSSSIFCVRWEVHGRKPDQKVRGKLFQIEALKHRLAGGIDFRGTGEYSRLMNQSECLGALFRLWLTSRHESFAVIAFSLATAISAAQSSDPTSGQGLQGNSKPIAAWSFSQTVGTLVPDASGHGFDATIYGQPVLQPRWGKFVALAFDGSGDNSFWGGGLQNCGLGISKTLTQSFTQLSIEAWVRKNPSGWMPIVYRDLWDNPSGFGLYTEWSAGKVVFGHYDSTGNHSQVQSETVIQDGQWHHIVGTMEPAGGCGGYIYRIYIDGQLDADQVGSLAVEEAPAGSGILKIAYPNASGADNPFQGSLDGIAIYDVALTAGQVKARFQATRQRLTSRPLTNSLSEAPSPLTE